MRVSLVLLLLSNFYNNFALESHFAVYLSLGRVVLLRAFNVNDSY